MKPFPVGASEEVLRCADQFVTTLKATAVFRRFEEATRTFYSDEKTQSMLKVLEVFQTAQQAGASPSNLQEVREAQNHIRNSRVVKDFLAARNAAGELLQETNRALSQPLGVDFGQTAGPAGGAC